MIYVTLVREVVIFKKGKRNYPDWATEMEAGGGKRRGGCIMLSVTAPRRERLEGGGLDAGKDLVDRSC